MTDECIVRMGGWIRLTSKVKLARTQNQGDGWMGGVITRRTCVLKLVSG